MQELGRLIISLGFFFILVGVIFFLLGKIPFAGKLPGDIVIEKENFSFYAPFGTMFLLSLILSLIFTLISNLKK